MESNLKLYRVSWADYGYDQYDSFIVAAESEEDAKDLTMSKWYIGEWAKSKDELEVSLVVLERGIIHSSYNAG